MSILYNMLIPSHIIILYMNDVNDHIHSPMIYVGSYISFDV